MTDDTTHVLPNTAPEPPEAPPVFGEWYPIERAPKDGSMFFCYVSAERHGEDDEGRFYSADVSEIDFGRWRECATSGGYYENMMDRIGDVQKITHFMPLPPKPSKKAAPKLPRVTAQTSNTVKAYIPFTHIHDSYAGRTFRLVLVEDQTEEVM